MTGDAGHDDDVAEHEAGRDRDRVLDQLGAVGNARHAQARRRQLHAAALEALAQEQRPLGWTSMPTPNALATQSAVMSSWVGPMPPVVNT